jgi:hypothetical protein
VIVKNGSPDHIGLMTLDNNVNHTRWPCVSHGQDLTCEQALYTASKHGFRTLVPQQPAPPVRRFVPPEQA